MSCKAAARACICVDVLWTKFRIFRKREVFHFKKKGYSLNLFKLSAVKLPWTVAGEHLLKQVESNPSVFKRIHTSHRIYC